MKMYPVVHFELPMENSERASIFYSNVFGWNMKNLGPDMMNYTTATTSECEENGLPKNPGMINGGLYQKDDSKGPLQYPSFVIAVDDLENHIKKIEQGGGKILGNPVEIPGFGWYVSFIDTEGNRGSIMQPTMIL